MAKYLLSLFLALSPVLSCIAEDAAIAAALAKGGIELSERGKTEQAKALFFKALAIDAGSPAALYELGRVYERDGEPLTAGDFYSAAAHALGEMKDLASLNMRKDALQRLQKLNPYAPRLKAAMEEYTSELGRIAKNWPDTNTRLVASDRVDELALADYVEPGKLPKIERPAVTAPHSVSVTQGNPGKKDKKSDRAPEPPPVVPQEIERELKAAGWDSVSGLWTKKSDGVYVVTNGRLVLKKSNGMISVIVHKIDSGSVCLLARAAYEHSGKNSDMPYNAAGFGLIVGDDAAQIFSNSGKLNDDGHFSPNKDIQFQLGNEPKNQFSMMLNEPANVMEMSMNNGAKTRKYTAAKISKNGPFMIAIKGTVTIEQPKAAGKR